MFSKTEVADFLGHKGQRWLRQLFADARKEVSEDIAWFGENSGPELSALLIAHMKSNNDEMLRVAKAEHVDMETDAKEIAKMQKAITPVMYVVVKISECLARRVFEEMIAHQAEGRKQP